MHRATNVWIITARRHRAMSMAGLFYPRGRHCVKAAVVLMKAGKMIREGLLKAVGRAPV